MPSGRIHDRLTLWSLPLLAGLTLERTHSANITLWVSGGFLFSGLMFGPDLDVYSQQFKRWGVLRWLWIPYQRSLRHRSIWSHAPVVGTLGRIGYLLLCLLGIGVILVLSSAVLGQAAGITLDWRVLARQMLTDSRESIERSLQEHWADWLALAIGLELGALLHSLSDWTGSTYKRWIRQPSKRPPKALPPRSPQHPSLPPKLQGTAAPPTLRSRPSQPVPKLPRPKRR